ncbi:MAG: HWE histidine kinase domain-containing protein [Acetobacterales bacterium]
MSTADAGRLAAASLPKAGFGLRTRMLFILLLAGVPGLIVAVFLTVQRFAEETAQIETGVTGLATLAAAEHDTVVANAGILLNAVVKTQQFDRIGDADCRTYFAGWSDDMLSFTSLTLFDPQGQVVCSNIDGELPFSAADQRWFEEAARQQNFTLSDYKLGRNGTPLLIAALPVISRSDETVGVVALGVSLNWLDFLAANVKLPPAGTITVLGPEGQILTHRAARSEEEETLPAVPPGRALDTMRARGSGTLRAADNGGTTRVYGFESTRLGGIVVVVGLPQFVEFTEWTSAIVTTLLSPFAVLLLALAAAGWASEALVVRHVRSLISTTEDIAAGDLEARSEVEYDEHEIGQLAASIDGMADSIEQSHTELEARSVDSALVAEEMQHRIGNTVAMAQVIAAQTLKHSRSEEHFNRAFSARLHALSVSNQLLLENDWKRAGLRQLLETLLAAHSSSESNPIHFSGPAVDIDSRAALAVSLAAHELATNAVKYGALSRPGGQVRLDWSVEERGGDRWLLLDWRESGGPTPLEPERHGFGGQMIKMMVEGQLGGRIDRTFTPRGLECRISFRWNEPSAKTATCGAAAEAAAE